jgi:hypothetical protein
MIINKIINITTIIPVRIFVTKENVEFSVVDNELFLFKDDVFKDDPLEPKPIELNIPSSKEFDGFDELFNELFDEENDIY